MDLRGMLNDNGPAAAAAAAAAVSNKPPLPQQIHIQTQAQPQPQPQPPSSHPSTPIQTIPQQPFRDYNQQTQPSPSRQYSQDYGPQHGPPGAFATSPYQGVPGPYANRPAPPPLQQIAPHDLRSPSIGPGPAPSPYRPTPTSSISTASGGYPFPPAQQPQQQTPTSPVQRHQYPLTSAFSRDGYPQPSGAVGMTGPPGAPSYMQGPPMPQTPPIGTAGGPHPYPHQRSQSSQSTPTPTSAQSQPGQYGAPYVHGSPVATTHSLPHLEHPQRQSSQPPTPIAGPLSAGPRPVQTLNNFAGQPPSPYQQRLQSTPSFHPPPTQTSPPPPPPPSLPRHPSSQSLYEQHGQDPLRRPPSHVERDRSISVSPKTRLPSLPSSAGRPGTSISDSEARRIHILSSSTMGSAVDHDRERDRAVTPAKRKLEERELRLDELEKRDARPPPFEDVNGRSAHPDSAATPHPSTSFRRQRRRRVYQQPPIWAQTAQDRRLANANCILYKPVQHHGSQLNGKSESLPSRHASPEERRATIVTQPVIAPPPAAPQAPEYPNANEPLGPWEKSITSEMPQESMTRAVADFLFAHILKSPDINDIQSRGVQFEIEAKLGILIDKNTNGRVNLPIVSDCVLSDRGGWLGFRSSMTEAQHKSYNDYLNSLVLLAHPDNKANVGRPQPRVPIKYLHRREIDRFFELPNSMRDSALPACVSSHMASRGHYAKVRVTYDQKTDEVLAKIVKCRIADISLHFPQCPLDCRISVNLEMEWDGEIDALERLSQASSRPSPPHRNKDRLSYTHSHYQVDLTQVTQVTQVVPGPSNAQRQEKEHELEIEVASNVLIDQGRRAMDNRPHQYLELVEGLVNNVVLLARKAQEWGP
ncbi:CYTH-like domain-containing protein [Apodospora peruviana]|uniref:mRNA-capping enzyme subunit beta n=1 Tax=Apodospora peruviana TaxID=516989 RepID=A0AAE0HUI7_9PEZI|nr:CYTH-like domain-containing protein [Apodospora peruviana]